jgi:RND family efflux transporter MFP subunit
MNRHAPSLVRFLRQIVGPGGTGREPDEQLLQRFAVHGDQAAFAALVARHGPMVLGVCGRLLQDANDAEDAFQATFLVLARRAGALARPHLLAHWLHGVARRTALEARARTTRRHVRERVLMDMATADPTLQAIWTDVRPVLDEEIARLPERYRVPFVLCYLEGHTHDETARLIGCPEGTVASRLSWARARLRGRLTMRGVTLSTGALAAVLVDNVTVTPARAGGIAAAAQSFASGLGTTRPMATRAASLAMEVLKIMFWTKMRSVSGMSLALCLLVGGLGALAWSAQDGEADGPAAATALEVIVGRPLVQNPKDELVLTGQTFADSAVNVMAGVTGYLDKLAVKNQDQVQRNQLLFAIDPATHKATLEQADAELKQAEAQCKQAAADFKAAQSQFAQKKISAAEVDAAVAGVELTKEIWQAAKAKRDIARGRLDATVVHAPVAGRIHWKMQPRLVVYADKTVVATIVGPGPLVVQFGADEQILLKHLRNAGDDPPSLRKLVGLPVDVGIAGEAGFPRRGKVKSFVRDARKNSVVKMLADLPNDDGIPSGQKARVRLVLGKPRQVLLVPLRAITNAGKESFLFVVNSTNVVEHRAVRLGPLHDGLRVVTDGVKANDWVVLNAPRRLHSGMTVKPQRVAVLGEQDEPVPLVLKKTRGLDVQTQALVTDLVTLDNNRLALRVLLKKHAVADVLPIVKDIYREKLAPRGNLALSADKKSNALTVDGPTDLVLEVARLVAQLEGLRIRPVPFKGGSGAGRTDTRPRLGVSVEPVTTALAEQLKLPRDVGVVVIEVLPDTPAAKVGIQKDDVLVKLDGAQVPSELDDFVRLVASLKADTPLEIVVLRKGQRIALGSVKLATSKSVAGSTDPFAGRPSGPNQAKEHKERIDELEAEVAALKERLAWSKRMLVKGYLSKAQLEADEALLMKAETQLENARLQLKARPASAKSSALTLEGQTPNLVPLQAKDTAKVQDMVNIFSLVGNVSMYLNLPVTKPQSVRFGTFKAGQEFTWKVVLRSTKPFRIRSVEFTNSAIQADWQDKAATTQVITVHCRLKHTGAWSGQMILHTDHPGSQPITLQLEANVVW